MELRVVLWATIHRNNEMHLVPLGSVWKRITNFERGKGEGQSKAERVEVRDNKIP